VVRQKEPAGGGQAHGVPRADARRNQQRILRAAARLLAEDPGVSMQRIADAAEVARPTVYRRYPNRETLINAILGQALEDLTGILRGIGERTERPGEAIADLLRAFAEVGVRYPMLLGFRPAAHDHDGDDGHGGPLTGWDELAGKFNGLVLQAQAQGALRPGIRPYVLLLSFIGALDMALQPTRHGASPEEANETASQVADIFLEGIQRR
jgi:AcrR family transcriptional regulator